MRDAAWFTRMGAGTFPGLLGIEIDEVDEGVLKASLALRNELLAPNG